MADEKLAPFPPIKLSELFAEHDRLGDAVKWICGDLALRRFDKMDEALEKRLSESFKKMGTAKAPE